MTGIGTLIYYDGSKYKGLFSNGKRHGVGTFKFKDGQVYNGHWENDKM